MLDCKTHLTYLICKEKNNEKLKKFLLDCKTHLTYLICKEKKGKQKILKKTQRRPCWAKGERKMIEIYYCNGKYFKTREGLERFAENMEMKHMMIC